MLRQNQHTPTPSKSTVRAQSQKDLTGTGKGLSRTRRPFGSAKVDLNIPSTWQRTSSGRAMHAKDNNTKERVQTMMKVNLTVLLLGSFLDDFLSLSSEGEIVSGKDLWHKSTLIAKCAAASMLRTSCSSS